MRYDPLTDTIYKMQKALLATAAAVRFIKAPGRGIRVDHTADKTNYPFILVHGFFGWGRNDPGNDTLAYWGMFSGNMLKRLNNSGFTAAAPSVNPVGSAWDRAYELYAQLTGTRVDYGKAHSARFGHPRYGADYTGRPLLPRWDGEHKINLIGHSFGGPTATLLASLLAYGDEEEKNADDDGSLSELFRGGKADRIYSISGIAAAYNGTTLPMSHQAMEALNARVNQKRADRLRGLPEGLLALPNAATNRLFAVAGHIASGTVAAPDTGLYDMHPDRSAELNGSIRMLPDVYYFSVPFDATRRGDDGACRVPDKLLCDPFFAPLVYVMGRTDTVTGGGMALDERWRSNDGLVNTISETAPFDKPARYVGERPGINLAARGFPKGIYHVFPTYRGAHMAMQGNVFRPETKGIKDLLQLMLMINAL